jgi:acetolactate synthase-1/2/3 large subunit
MIKLVENEKVPRRKSYFSQFEIEKVHRQWLSKRGIESDEANRDSSEIHPLRIIKKLREFMLPDDIIICDSGFNQIWGGQYFEVNSAGRTYIGPRGFGNMGYSFPGAIGAKIANPSKKIVALCGDGGFAMNLQELETAKRIGMPVIVCVMNNRNLEYIKSGQRYFHESRYISVDFTDINFANVAQAFGCDGFRVENNYQMDEAFKKAFQSEVPFVLDIKTKESAEPEHLTYKIIPKSS